MATQTRGSGGGFGRLLLILVALALIIGPLWYPPLTGLSRIMLVGFGVFLLILGSVIVTITRLYRKAAADEAFVRTGMGGLRAIIDGGALVVPVVHDIIPVSLRTMRLDVERSGTNALITGDNLRADVTAEFYIKVQKDQDDVVAAATSLGERAVNAENVKDLVFEKLVSALRTVAATRPLNELHAKRDDFAQAVQQIVEKDLAHNGLTLETVTISKLDQTPPDAMRAESNVFDAQGLRTITEITQVQRVSRNKIEREADKGVTAQNVERDKFIYEQEVARAEAEAARDRDIQKAQAKAKQEAETLAAEQARLAGIAEVKKDEAIQVAEVEKAKAIEVTNQQREQAVSTAEIEKERAVEIADREKEIAVATKEKERAEADAQRFAAEAAREKEKQAVLTVEVTQTAERDKDRTVIEEQAEIEKQRLRQQMEAEVKAYAAVKAAEGEQVASEKRAEARMTLAEAEKNAKVLEAEGEKAMRMVPINVEREQVEVERARVNVKREDLKNQAEFETIARQLQVELARVEAEKEVRIAMANAMGEALSKARMTVWGDPATVARLSEAFFKGQTYGFFADGLAEGTPESVKEAASNAFYGIGQAGAAFIERLTGQKVDPSKLEEVIKAAVSSSSQR